MLHNIIKAALKNDRNLNEVKYSCDYDDFVDYGCGGVVLIIGIVMAVFVTSV